MSTSAWAGVCLLLALVPFEATQPLVRLPGQSLSSAEAVLFLVFGTWGAAAAASCLSSGWRSALASLHSSLLAPWLAFLAAMWTAAMFASVERTNAVHMAARFTLAFGVFLVAVAGITSRERARRVFGTAVVVGTVVSLLAVLEFTGVPAVLRFLTAFRPGVAVVGAQVRAAGPLQYPTIASMYLEILFAFGLALLPAAIVHRQTAIAIGVAAALLLMAEAVVLTFTRSGLITVGLSVLIVGAWWWREHGFDAGTKGIAGVAFLVAVELISSRSLEIVRLRMMTEGQGDWFHANVEAPAALTMATGAETTVPVRLTNTGLTTWDSHAPQPVRLAYHWLLPDVDQSIDFEGLRTEFPERVGPGESVALDARVRVPRQPGRYRLMWDVVEEGRLWFSTEEDAETTVTPVTVTGLPNGRIGAPRAVWLPKGPSRPGRIKLWKAAGRMWLDHPLLGVGPDNYRLLYGPYAQISNADRRVHSNNMYIEVLAGGGLVAALAFAWLCWRTVSLLAHLARRAGTGGMTMLAAGTTAACAAIAVHGLADSFFSFTATYVLFAITLGLVVSCDRLASAHAHRV